MELCSLLGKLVERGLDRPALHALDREDVARMTRIVDERLLLRTLRRSQQSVAVAGSFLRWLERQPEHPDLVGSTAASRILGIPDSHITKLRSRGLLRAIPVEGSPPVYLRAEVQALARERQREREKKANG